MKQAIYLKTNLDTEFAIRNVMKWLDIVYLRRDDCYIICDKPEIEKKIRENAWTLENVHFIESIKDETAEELVEGVCHERWKNAGYAHLTTFIHSRDVYDCFWNIDADDTNILLSEMRILEMMQVVEHYAFSNHINIFSLDMWKSFFKGDSWSFGITFTVNNVDWIDEIRCFMDYEEYISMTRRMVCNLDLFFHFISQNSTLKIGTFYFENMKFIHYTDDFFYNIRTAAFYHWFRGKLIYPILYYCMGDTERGMVDIAEDVIRFDIGITSDETRDTVEYWSRQTDGNRFMFGGNLSDVACDEIYKERVKKYFDKHNFQNKKLVCFGTGACFEDNLELIKRYLSVQIVCDNNEEKWNSKIAGLTCISPNDLKGEEDVVLLTFYADHNIKACTEQLHTMGITNIVKLTDVIAYVEYPRRRD